MVENNVSYDESIHHPIIVVRERGMFKCRRIVGGFLPEQLQGSYTTVNDAVRAIEAYFLPKAKPAKRRRDGKLKIVYKTCGRPSGKMKNTEGLKAGYLKRAAKRNRDGTFRKSR